MEETENWVVQINNELKGYGSLIFETEKEYWKNPSIYKIPSCITELNSKAYMPLAVSFGPYHHHAKEHLKAMEGHKHRALLHFLKRCQKPIELLFQRMGQVVQQLKDSYMPPLNSIEWTQDRFLRMMILDGCFMLEIFRASDCIPDDYADNDPVFSEHGKLNVMPYIKRDMLVLENQLPIMALHTLIEVESGKTQEEDDERLNTQILKFFYPCIRQGEFGSMGKCMHVLDVYRKSVILHGPSRTTRMPKETGDRHEITGSATELRKAGIWFRKSPTKSLRDVSFSFSFHRGVLRLPALVVDDTTESIFLNLIAFERLHVGAGKEVSSYVLFMDTIIKHEMDAALLHRKGILINTHSDVAAMATLFKSLSKDITADSQQVLDAVQMSISNYCNRPWNKWRAYFIHTYLRNPKVIGSLAAAFLFAFNIIQSGFAIADYFQLDKFGSLNLTRPHCP